MSILDEFDRKITQISKGAIKKTKDVSESVKVSSLIRDEEVKLKEAYQKIGQYYYENMRNLSDEAIEILCKGIDERKSRLAEYNGQLRQLKKLITCSNCGTANPADALFCVGCGAKLKKEESAISYEQKVCPNCGMAMDEDQIFCTNCGTKYSKILKELKETPAPTPSIDKQSIAPKEKANYKRCRNCGAELDEKQKFCNKCGTPCKEVKGATDTIVCPDCGKVLKPSQRFCTGCGRKMLP